MNKHRAQRAYLALIGMLLLTFAALALPGKASAYDACQCTGYAWSKRQDLPLNLGNAKDWANNATARGFPVDGNPRVGDIAVFPAGVQGADPSFGHVAYVEAVYSPTSYRVSERNWLGSCDLHYRDASTSGGVRFIHPRGTVTPSDMFVTRMNGTGTGMVEMHIATRESNYRSWSLHTGTAQPPVSADQAVFRVADYNSDGRPDLYLIAMGQTGTGMTEVHILDGATNYSSFLLHTGTPQPQTTASQHRMRQNSDD